VEVLRYKASTFCLCQSSPKSCTFRA
jgi:hypothetical protein